MDKWSEVVPELRQAIEDGKIQTKGSETIKEAKFEEIPQVWKQLFDGRGIQGKLITQLK
jgi:NADPH-dependent curcumin reductase CurA